MSSLRPGTVEHMDDATLMPLMSWAGMTSGMSTRKASAASSSGIMNERRRSERKRITARILLLRLFRYDAQFAQQLAIDVGAAVEHQAILELLQLVHPEHDDDAATPAR